MRARLCALALLAPTLASAAAASWAAVSGTSRSVVGTCASGTCDAPTGTPSAATALMLDGVDTVDVWISADSGQTLTAGTVTLLAYRYDAKIARWFPAPDLNVTVTAPGSTRDLYSPGYTLTGRGFLRFVPSSVAVSSGGLTITLLAWSKQNGAM